MVPGITRRSILGSATGDALPSGRPPGSRKPESTISRLIGFYHGGRDGGQVDWAGERQAQGGPGPDPPRRRRSLPGARLPGLHRGAHRGAPRDVQGLALHPLPGQGGDARRHLAGDHRGLHPRAQPGAGLPAGPRGEAAARGAAARAVRHRQPFLPDRLLRRGGEPARRGSRAPWPPRRTATTRGSSASCWKACSAGVFRDVPPRLVVFGVLGMVNWVHKWYNPAGRWGAEEISTAFLSLIEGGLLRQKRRGPGAERAAAPSRARAPRCRPPARCLISWARTCPSRAASPARWSGAGRSAARWCRSSSRTSASGRPVPTPTARSASSAPPGRRPGSGSSSPTPTT